MVSSIRVLKCFRAACISLFSYPSASKSLVELGYDMISKFLMILNKAIYIRIKLQYYHTE